MCGVNKTTASAPRNRFFERRAQRALVASDERVVDRRDVSAFAKERVDVGRRALARVVDVGLVRRAEQCDLSPASRTDQFGDAPHDTVGHTIVHPARRLDELGIDGIRVREEVRVDGDTVAPDAWAGRENVHSGCLFASAIVSHTSTPSSSAKRASSLAKAMFTSRNVFSTTFTNSATVVVVVAISASQTEA